MTYSDENVGIPTYEGSMTLVNHNFVEGSDVVVNGLKQVLIKFSFEVQTDGWINPPSDVSQASDPVFQAFVDHMKAFVPGSDLDFNQLSAFQFKSSNKVCTPTEAPE